MPELFLKLYTVRGDRRVIERPQQFSSVINEIEKNCSRIVCKNVENATTNIDKYYYNVGIPTATYLLQ